MSSATYSSRVLEVLKAIQVNEAETLRAVSERLVDCVREDRIIYTFGSGHSSLLAAEGLFRAGGLACVSAILEPSTTFAAGAVAGSAFERKVGAFQEIIDRYPVSPGDALVVFSNSGVNALPVELTQHCRQAGLTTVAITSRRYAEVAARSNGSTCTLLEVAEYVIDNHLPPGDALVGIGTAGPNVAPGSTVAGAYIWNALQAEVAVRLKALRLELPVYVSSNTDGAKEVNEGLVRRYRQRVRNL